MGEALATATSPDIYFNPWDENFRANPYPHYRPLLEGPLRIIDMGFKFALAARYADVRAILMDHATFSSVLPNLTNLLPSWWGTYGWFFGVAIGGGVYYVLAMIHPRAMPLANARA